MSLNHHIICCSHLLLLILMVLLKCWVIFVFCIQVCIWVFLPFIHPTGTLSLWEVWELLVGLWPTLFYGEGGRQDMQLGDYLVSFPQTPTVNIPALSKMPCTLLLDPEVRGWYREISISVSPTLLFQLITLLMSLEVLCTLILPLWSCSSLL